MKISLTKSSGAILKPNGNGRALLEIPGAFVEEGNCDSNLVLRFKTTEGQLIATADASYEDHVVSLVFNLGATVVDPLAEDGRAIYALNMDGIAEDLRLRINGRLTPSYGAAGKQKEVTPDPQVEPSSKTNEITQESITVTKIEQEVKIPKKSKLVLSLIAVLAIALLLVVLYFWLTQRDTSGQVVPAQESSVPAQSPTSVSSAKSITCSLSSSQDDKVILNACLQSKASETELLKLASQAMQEDRCEVGVRIYSSLARTGAKGAALDYARLFDPKVQMSSSCIKKDETQSRYWYEKALKSSDQDEVAKATEALKP